jgi:hypothetical protein
VRYIIHLNDCAEGFVVSILECSTEASFSYLEKTIESCLKQASDEIRYRRGEKVEVTKLDQEVPWSYGTESGFKDQKWCPICGYSTHKDNDGVHMCQKTK